MTTAAPPSDPTAASPSFGSRLRRLSQRRPKNQPSSSPNTSSSTPSSGGHRSYRKRLSWVVGLTSSHTPAAPEDYQHSHQPGAELSTPPLPPQEAQDIAHSPSAELESASQRYSVFSRSDAESSESSTSEEQQQRPPATAETTRPSRRNRLEALSSRYLMAPASNVGPSTSDQQQQASPPEASRLTDQSAAVANETAMATDGASSSSATGNSTAKAGNTAQQQSTIRFFPWQDRHQNSRPSLPFAPMTRTLLDESTIIKVGRYSERDGAQADPSDGPSAAPLGFKSKVVSRKHCEFSFINGRWHIKDVGSSSGTFLNHMRLSQPNVPSRQYAIRDGDVVQLGIDFRGGEELIFRCVRIRIECNRMWQQKANEFNKNTETLITNLGKPSTLDAEYKGCRECSICLGSVLRPYQSLFMAACAHVWHYKCIRRLIHSPEYPMFQCPNCRAYTDLNADTDDSHEDLDQPVPSSQQPNLAPNPAISAVHAQNETDSALAAATGNMTLESDPEPELGPEIDEPDHVDMDLHGPAAQNASATGMASHVQRSANIDILSPDSAARTGTGRRRVADSDNRDTIFVEDPMTPRNDTGLLALDGRAGRL